MENPKSRTGGELLADNLIEMGVDRIFNVSSTGQSPFYDALMSRPSLRLVAAVQEGQAISMAEGHSLATSEVSVAMLPSIGLPQAMSNLFNAMKDGASIVVISDGAPESDPEGFQHMPGIMEVMDKFAKWTTEIQRPEDVAAVVRKAITTATANPPSPVYLRIPNSVLKATTSRDDFSSIEAQPAASTHDTSHSMLEDAAEILMKSDLPLINVGSEISRSKSNQEIIQLAELAGVAVTQGLSVTADFPFQHHLFAGFYYVGYPRIVKHIDGFINLGAPMPDANIVTTALPQGTNSLDWPVYDSDVNDSTTRHRLRKLLEKMEPLAKDGSFQKIKTQRLETVGSFRQSALKRRKQIAEEGWDNIPMYSERLFFEFDGLLKRDACVILETGNRHPMEWMRLGFGEKTMYGPSTGFALGWGLGTALGVKLAQPQTQVVAFIGDGAFLFGQIESLWAAARHQIPVIVVILNNRSYDSERTRVHFSSVVARTNQDKWRDMSSFLGDPDVSFVNLARGFGIDGETISEPREIEPALARAKNMNERHKPYLIDARVARRGPGAESSWHP